MINRIKVRLAKWFNGGMYPNGHFYSPIPDISVVREEEARIFSVNKPMDIDLNDEQQFIFLQQSLPVYQRFSFPTNPMEGYRYYSDNSYFNLTDALTLFLVFHKFKPRQVVEIGSGFSTGCMLDTCEKYLRYSPRMTFIEPYPERLKSLLSSDELSTHTLLAEKVQHVDSDLFKTLEKDDLLFVDSSHISKAGSDLNYILFEILPLLKSGVIIHFHDICYPFEYPKEWIYSGIFWNEAYLLRSFLMNNDRYEIVLFNHFAGIQFQGWLRENMPLFNHGGSLYLRKK